jgi:Na+-translocating ferredoxin:NAD+ oxidoreductase RnfD subunit
MEYNVNANKRKPLITVLVIFAVGLAIALVPTVYGGLPDYVFHLPALVIFTVCISLLVRFVMTDYTYQLKDSPDTMSNYPKLNAYRIKKSGSNMTYCIPFNNVSSIKRVEKVKNPGYRYESLCVSMNPEEVYMVTYFIDTEKRAVFLECNEIFAKEIEKRIELWSQVKDFEEDL